MADHEIALEREEAEKPEKAAGKTKPAPEAVKLPVLIEFTMTMAAIFLVLLFVTIVGISVVTGANLFDFVFRTSISILLIGGLLVIIVRQITFAMFSTAAEAETTETPKAEETQLSEKPNLVEAK